ncbi:hypothetical protein ACKI2N_028550 [Cupriavidus sp. 30B13]
MKVFIGGHGAARVVAQQSGTKSGAGSIKRGAWRGARARAGGAMIESV